MRFSRLFTCLTFSVLILCSLGDVRAVAAQASIMLSVDASEAPRKIFHARLVIPAAPGPLTLYYPQWIPGEHGPTGPITDLAGLKFTAAGKPLAWRRDPVDMYALHCEVPAGASAVEVSLDYLSPSGPRRFTSSAAATAQLAIINWNQLVIYPGGFKTDDLTVVASLHLPPGWKFGTALPVAKQTADTVEFQPVSLTTLIDSPVITGAYFRAVPVTPPNTLPHEIDLAADSAAALEISSRQIAQYTRLVAEAGALFGARHYRSYHFLFALSDHVQHFGLEHHESSDNRSDERTLVDEARFISTAELLPHEFAHSWNGKYRRPAGLTTPDYETPMKGELLWVYEGLTQYLGSILAARSGLLSPELWRGEVALTAAEMDYRAGRTWRPLQDTADAAQILYGAREEWSAWRRSVDYYPESELIWLEVDTIIRRESQGRRSLDDFCQLFHGGESSPPMVKPYTFDDVVATLNQVAPYDWRGFLRTRLDSTQPRAPLGGIENAGWRLVYSDVRSDYLRARERTQEYADATFSIGLRLKRPVERADEGQDGRIMDVIPGLAAAEAGIAPGMTLMAVNGRRWSPDILRAALRASKTSREPLELLVENGGFYRTYRLDYHDGERYPQLERDRGKADLLSEISKPKTPQPSE